MGARMTTPFSIRLSVIRSPYLAGCSAAPCTRGGPPDSAAVLGKGDTHMDRPPWFLDEVAHAGDEHLDPAYVATGPAHMTGYIPGKTGLPGYVAEIAGILLRNKRSA